MIEVKTDIPAIEVTIRKVDEKVRLGPEIAKKRFGWEAHSVGSLLVMPERSTLRRRLERHASLFASAFPVRGSQIRRWITHPSGAIGGLWFLSPSRANADIRGGGGPERVRRPRGPTTRQPGPPTSQPEAA